ncbi:MAG TPA: GspMb/PilO family protein [Candidatus Limnocylindrales bacterium]|nr:GspMb/PilO family protein [Candidatus Acidoferrum sp.]HTS13987.1 GspMb/PilO family protein [Candidatus Limnocylindrales bacterium]
MTLNKNWSAWKKSVLAALCVLFALDLALALFLWQGGREGPESRRRQRDHLQLQAKLLKADVDRGEKIRASLPQVGKDCDGFYKSDFLPASTGYSAVLAEFTEITHKTGLKTGGISFQQKELKDHGVTQVSMKTTVEGDYPALIEFIHALEKSKNFYLLDNLTLASGGATPGVKLNLDLRTFFRT